jgi:peptide/bleomycin uptake transporter
MSSVVEHVYRSRFRKRYRNFYDLLENAGALSANASTTEQDWINHQRDVRNGLWDFARIAIVAVTVMPVSKLVRSLWALRWRLALMKAYVLAWDANRPPIEGASQRVHEDSYRFSKGVELCLTTVLDSFITLIVFIPILTALGSETPCPRSIHAFAWLGGGWLVGVSIVSASVGLAVTVVLGHRLVRLEVDNQKVEATLRRDLVVLETAPSNICTAMHLPDAVEHDANGIVDPSCTLGDTGVTISYLSPLPHFLPLVGNIRKNYDRLFLNFTMLNLWLAMFDQFNVILPYIIFAPLLFSPDPDSRILLGALIQVSNSFDKVFGSLSVVADNWPGINEFRSVLLRLGQFEQNVFYNVPYPSRKRDQWMGWKDMVRMRVSGTRFGQPTEVVTPSTQLQEGPSTIVDASRV